MARPALDPDALPVILRQRSRRKLGALGMALMSSVFPLAGTALLGVGIADRGLSEVLGGVAILIVAGPVWLYWALQLIPGSCRLQVTSAGFSARHCFVTHAHSWDEVGRFYPRTYASPRLDDYEAVAFTGDESRVLGLGSFLDELRMRGIASTDVLPDTYGYDAEELAGFLNACSERFGERSPEHVPDAIPVSRGYLIGISVVLAAAAAAFLAWAVKGALDGDAGDAALALVFAAPFAFALAKGWTRWRRGTLRRGTRFRGPAESPDS